MSGKKYQIFISSTYEDLIEERKSVLEAILMTNNIPIGMESFVASSQEQFEYIKNCINDCDYYILIVGWRYGSIHPSLKLSYTELEFDYAKSINKPILVFVRENICKCRKKDIDLMNINNFRDKIQKEHLCQFFNNKTELKGLALTALNQEITHNPQQGWIRNNEPNSIYKNQKDIIQKLIIDGEILYQKAYNHFQQVQQFGICVPPFPQDTEFKLWIQKIIEFIKVNNLEHSYLYKYSTNTPYVKIINEQLILLQGLMTSFEYKETITM